MLECNAVEGRVDEATYTHIIRMWVKDVRDRSERSSLEVTALSDSEVSVCVCVCLEMRLLLNLAVFMSCPGRMVYHQRRKTTPLVCQLRAQYIVRISGVCCWISQC